MIAEADKVVGYFKCSGTQGGEWRGKPPSGKRFENVDEIYIFGVRHGKLASALAAVEDNMSRMSQLGLSRRSEMPTDHCHSPSHRQE